MSNTTYAYISRFGNYETNYGNIDADARAALALVRSM